MKLMASATVPDRTIEDTLGAIWDGNTVICGGTLTSQATNPARSNPYGPNPVTLRGPRLPRLAQAGPRDAQ